MVGDKYNYKGANLETNTNGDVNLYRAVSEVEYHSVKSTGQFSATQESMETKWMATNYADAQRCGKALEFGEILK